MFYKFYIIFTEPDLYPIYFHCWGGADRAGTFAFLLGSLLGMETNDLIKEYEWTSLSIRGIRTRNYDKFQNFIKGLDDYGDEKSFMFLRYLFLKYYYKASAQLKNFNFYDIIKKTVYIYKNYYEIGINKNHCIL